MQITEAAKILGVRPWLLDTVIRFESNNNPFAVSQDKKSYGLIQFRNQALKSINIQSGQELFSKFGSYSTQLEHAVVPYLLKLSPFIDDQDFLMSVFYPRYRRAWEFLPFPVSVIKNNVGINTPFDYISMVYSTGKKFYIPKTFYVIIIGGVLWKTIKS